MRQISTGYSFGAAVGRKPSPVDASTVPSNPLESLSANFRGSFRLKTEHVLCASVRVGSAVNTDETSALRNEFSWLRRGSRSATESFRHSRESLPHKRASIPSCVHGKSCTGAAIPVVFFYPLRPGPNCNLKAKAGAVSQEGFIRLQREVGVSL